MKVLLQKFYWNNPQPNMFFLLEYLATLVETARTFYMLQACMQENFL